MRGREIFSAICFFVSGACLLVCLTACGDTESREEAAAALEARMAQIDAQLETLRAKAAVAKDDAKERTARLINDLEQKREQAARTLRDMKDASAPAWRRFKDDARSALDNLESAVKSAANEIR